MENKDIIIEQVTEFSSDISDAIKKLAPKIGRNYKELVVADITEMIDSPNTFIFVAKDKKDNKIAGMITLIVIRIPYVKKSSFEDLIVDEEYRGHGIGSMLLEKALEVAKEKGAAYVDFTSRPTRTAGNNLYEKLGFEKRDTNVYRRVFDYGEV